MSVDNYSEMLWALARSVLPGRTNTILEIGMGPAVSSRAFIRALLDVGEPNPRLFSVELSPSYPPQEVLDSVRRDLVEWVRVYGDSAKVCMEELPVEVDLLYIDGDHGGDHVKSDYRRFSPLVRAGGLIVFDDYPISDGVAAVVDEMRRDVCVEGVVLMYNQQDGNSHYVVRIG